MVKTKFISKKKQRETFCFIASGDAMELFKGSAFVPGIKEARVINGGREIVVRDSWGLEHKESVVSLNPFSSLVFYIDPNRFLRLFLKSLSEEWTFKENSSGTLVERTFSLAPRPWAGILLPFIEKRLEQAIRKNNETLSFYLLLDNKKINKPLALAIK